MPRPLTVHPFTSFLGTVEGINNVILPEMYSPSDSINVYLDKSGQVTKIPGWSTINSTPIVTNSGGEDVEVKGIFLYQRSNGTDYIAHVCSTNDSQINELWRSQNDGGTWSFLYALNSGSTYRVRALQVDDLLYITAPMGSADGPFLVYNGSTISTGDLTQSPTPSASATGTGNLTGTYKWKLVSMVGDVRQEGSAASTARQLEGEQGSLSWSADSNTSVTGYELYRTTGTGELYYFVTFIEGRTTVAYVDNIPDRVILANRTLQEHGDAPPGSPVLLTSHKGRMFYRVVGVTGFANRVYYSDPGRPASVGDLSYFTVQGPSRITNKITGMVGDFEGRLVIFKRHEIWTVSGTGAVIDGVRDWYVRQTASQTGAVSDRTIVRIPAGALYKDANGSMQRTQTTTLAFVSGYGDIRLFDGERDVIISSDLGPIGLINSASTADPNGHAIHDPRRGLVWFWPASSSLYGVWDYRHGTWHRWDQYNCSCALVRETTGHSVIMGGTVQPFLSNSFPGHVLELFDESEETDPNGDPFVARWASGLLYGFIGEDTAGVETTQPAVHLTKRWRWAELVMKSGANIAAQAYITDETGTVFTTKVLDLSSSGSADVVEKIQFKNSSGRFLHSHGMRIIVEDTATPDDRWTIKAIAVAYNPLEGTKRDAGRPGA